MDSTVCGVVARSAAKVSSWKTCTDVTGGVGMIFSAGRGRGLDMMLEKFAPYLRPQCTRFARPRFLGTEAAGGEACVLL